MCGRIACMLDPNVVCRACSFRDPKSGGFMRPQWRDHPPSSDPNTTYKYYPDTNVAPTRFVPVMFSKDKDKEKDLDVKQEGLEEAGEADASQDIVVTPMMFGLIPAYHKGEAKNHGLSTNNARLEGLPNSRLYKPLLTKKKLCVVLCQGFYEWKTVGVSGKTKKQPYLIFAPQEDGVKVADLKTWESAEFNQTDGWNGPRILKMAGLYDVWKSPTGDRVYSCTIITMGANKTLSWMHDRMPAILETEEQVMGWLNAPADMDTNDLIKTLKQAEKLQWYTVDQKVGNSRCHDADCMDPIDSKTKPSQMDNWLKKSTPVKKKGSDVDDEKDPDNKPADKKKPKPDK